MHVAAKWGIVGGVALAVWTVFATPGGVSGVVERVQAMTSSFDTSITSGLGAPYFDALQSIGAAAGLPDRLLARVAYQESRFRTDIITGATVSSAGAVGMFQIVPKWHPDAPSLTDWHASGQYAANYLSQLYRQFGDWGLALAAYNWGPGNLKKNGIDNAPTETRNYYTEILADVPGTGSAYA